MTFRYKRFLVQPIPGRPIFRSVLRPVIPIHLILGGRRIAYEALIDSGADFSIFHAEIGEAIGVKVRKRKAIIFSGIAGIKQKGYRHTMRLEIGGKTILCPAIFSYELKTPYGILGQEIFFEKFKVLFDLGTEQIELHSR